MKNTKLALFFFFKKLISAPLALLNSCSYSAIRYRIKKDTEFSKKNITDLSIQTTTVMKNSPKYNWCMDLTMHQSPQESTITILID
ncbi:hypothetical protein NG55_04970 [Acinetobacter gyllenbergii]|nr:hypothetical protein NG55_04970 [Acinetobacter gyllenbergii]